ncbi:MBL fold metallo-hydrolase [Ornithinibacillus gellani]|uniref:MBL fold metallo-hydrolase n=1 Tax=Ornithinibacillus gellani TaxID=2293253 RepID=UPI000F4A96C7|nr:MBL fold metallo-hydrolase [Ornithinibacillus gellani]TQS76638.1 MBL fold metallo-hydrolase [Ornithinibacillus gellani]
MKLTVVGCWGGFPAPNGATSCYLLEKDGFKLVIDLGSGALSHLQAFQNIRDLDAVILSHYHHDHVADIGVLQYAKLVAHYVEKREEILPIYGHTEDKAGFDALTHEFTRGIAYHPDQSLELGPFSISFLKTKHPVPCYGMRISAGNQSIVYTADTSYQQQWIPFSRDADLLIVDCNFYAEQDGSAAGHMTSKEGAYIAEQAQVGGLLLSHLPQYGQLEQLVEEAKSVYHGNVYLATKGLKWS